MDIFKKDYIFLDIGLKDKENSIDFIAGKAVELSISNDKDQTKRFMEQRKGI